MCCSYYCCSTEAAFLLDTLVTVKVDSAFECTAPRRLGSVTGPRGPGLLRSQSILPASSTQSRCYTSHPTILTLLSDKEHFQNPSPSAKNGLPGRCQIKQVSG